MVTGHAPPLEIKGLWYEWEDRQQPRYSGYKLFHSGTLTYEIGSGRVFLSSFDWKRCCNKGFLLLVMVKLEMDYYMFLFYVPKMFILGFLPFRRIFLVFQLCLTQNERFNKFIK